ncbi:MAG: ATP-binding protein [Candidatus Latescibacteria bacterium]|nr:ATP-binding protein [Candidatus Latescibacterota bacterium]
MELKSTFYAERGGHVKNRTLFSFIKQKSASRLGRLIALTGARQTGKTTLVQKGFPDYSYISLDDPITRPDFTTLSAAQWYQQYPNVILDEVQKASAIIESIKAVYDQYSDARSILLGSSQILLMEQIRESLAGRISLIELYPLTLPEMLTDSWDDTIVDSRFIHFLKTGERDILYSGMPLQSERYAQVAHHMAHYLNFGAMPAIVDPMLTIRDKYDWLHDYIQTYLQRDLRDLANLRDLTPFARMQRALAGLTGVLLNMNELAQLTGVTSKTVKRFISYLEISYQVILLQPWFRNLNKRLSKAPKVHFLDPGIQRALLNRRGQPTGHEFESAIIAEIYKQIQNSRLPIDCYHLRTVDGREVDLLLETEQGFVPIEIKMAERISFTDARHLRKLDEILDKPILQGLVLSNDPRIHDLGDDIVALPVGWALGA